MEIYFLGIDIGTQGARAVLVNSKGQEISSGAETFPLTENSRQEQSPQLWWETCQGLVSKLLAQPLKGELKSISVTSTSGTVIPLDINNEPLHPAIMYSDKRSAKEGEYCSVMAKTHTTGYTGFNASSGLSKMVWFARNYPEKKEKLVKWVHAADYITGKLSSIWDATDHTNALKSGYDLDKELWPDYLFEELGLKRDWLPRVFPSGTVIGNLNKKLATGWGLNHIPKITVGITDGCASQIASGAIKPGDWNTTIGTTLVVKGVTKLQIVDNVGRFYSHKHPQGFWMPGGASNTGADWISADFGEDLNQLEQQAAALIPTPYLSYPLRQRGERFPFMAPNAEGFEPEGLSRAESFTSNMEGVAYLERYAFEIARKLSGEAINGVYTAGGGSSSQTWLKIRSNVLNLPVYKMKMTSGAFGAAVVAASQTHYSGLTEAGENMIVQEQEILPETALSSAYNERYTKFIDMLLEKNYIKQQNYA